MQLSYAVPILLVAQAFPSSRLSWQTGAGFANQASPPFIVTDRGSLWVKRLLIEIQHIFHTGDIPSTSFRNTPHFLLPGLQFVFLSVRRTVLCEIASTACNCTSLPASSRKVQRTCPSGASEQAVAINVASALPSGLRFWPGRGSSFKVLSMPSTTKRRGIRFTQGRLTFNTDIICGLVNPSPAFNSIIARLNFRGLISPFRVTLNSFCRSLWLRLIMYFFQDISRVSFHPEVRKFRATSSYSC